ncbi:MAG TPA: transglutaminase-like domain-containing protein [Phycisphaerae bacterium]|nr:transglutaminase-like domain-containing protein [Phycisphaerae bacterium]
MHKMTEYSAAAGAVCLVLMWLGLAVAPAGAVTRGFSMSAAEAFERGMECAGLQHDLKGGVVLYDATLIDDDGVAGGGGDPKWTAEEERSPSVPVDADTQIKKVLVVDRPEALEAVLYVRPGRAELLFNGQSVRTAGSDKFFRVPPQLVKKGNNEVIVRARGSEKAGVKLMLRRQILENAPELKDRPPRSFKSTDGGKTWQPLDGELTIRLHLTQHRAEGSFVSPVIDAAATNAAELPLVPVSIASAKVSADADAPKGTSVEFLVRVGSTPVYEKASWSDWQAPGEVSAKGRRFIQWKAILRTADPKVTPVLRKVLLEAAVVANPGSPMPGKVTVKAFHNEEIRYTSMPFTYEDPAHPRMKALREKYKLDDVVKDAKTELEKFARLRHWVGQQWRFKGPPGHYPAWDADEILTRKTGMCCQYAMVLIQGAISLGHQARYVCGYHPGTMGTAHEVSEIWSNEHAKWVFMDPTPSRNEYAADPKTGVPLSMLELHDRMIKHYYGDKPATYANRPRTGKWSSNIALVRGADSRMEIHTEDDPPPRRNWPSWTKWRQLCYVPRNDWYAKPNALPRLQGWNNWDWTGFWNWYDRQVPRDLRYALFTSRRSDVEWTINQVRFAAACGGKGILAVQMGTVTPYFDTFLVNVDGAGWKAVDGAAYQWSLKPGANRLEMRIRNSSGVVGRVSFIELEYESE